MVSVKTLFLETRPQYLLLSILLVVLGASLAFYQGSFHSGYFLLCLVGLVLLHISTNVLNDYFDYSSGIDLETQRTPFNGGSGILNEGLLSPRQALLFGLAAFALAVPIGGYFVAQMGWSLLPLFLLGSVFVIGSSSHITRLGFGLGELAAGLGLGALPVFGTAWIIQGSPSAAFWVAAVPSGLWVANLLFLNEFPDEQADRRGGRKTLVIQLGFEPAQRLYSALSMAAWLWIVGAVLVGAMPVPCLLALLALPLAWRAIRLSRRPAFGGEFVQAQAANVGLVLAGHFLLALGYGWAALL
jgi:1,4-dihydroxy-2-naphthoate octaprenyltransferase